MLLLCSKCDISEVISTSLAPPEQQKHEKSDKKSEKNIRRYTTLLSVCLIQSDVALWRRHWQNGGRSLWNGAASSDWIQTCAHNDKNIERWNVWWQNDFFISLNIGMKMLCRKRKDMSFVKPSLYFFIYTTPGYFWIDTEIRQTPASLPFRKRRFTVMRLGIYGKKNLWIEIIGEICG